MHPGINGPKLKDKPAITGVDNSSVSNIVTLPQSNHTFIITNFFILLKGLYLKLHSLISKDTP